MIRSPMKLLNCVENSFYLPTLPYTRTLHFRLNDCCLTAVESIEPFNNFFSLFKTAGKQKESHSLLWDWRVPLESNQMQARTLNWFAGIGEASWKITFSIFFLFYEAKQLDQISPNWKMLKRNNFDRKGIWGLKKTTFENQSDNEMFEQLQKYFLSTCKELI